MTTVERDIRLNPNEQAAGMADHWRRFTEGIEPSFFAYFMLEDQNHEELRKLFLDRIHASPELPYPDSQPVIKIGRAILVAYSNRDEQTNLPFDVWYTGKRIEPVQ